MKVVFVMNLLFNFIVQLNFQARLLFLKGVENEQKGKHYEAIQFYRRAVQLVPDIESRLYESTNQRQVAEINEGNYVLNFYTSDVLYKLVNKSGKDSPGKTLQNQ